MPKQYTKLGFYRLFMDFGSHQVQCSLIVNRSVIPNIPNRRRWNNNMKTLGHIVILIILISSCKNNNYKKELNLQYVWERWSVQPLLRGICNAFSEYGWFRKSTFPDFLQTGITRYKKRKTACKEQAPQTANQNKTYLTSLKMDSVHHIR